MFRLPLPFQSLTMGDMRISDQVSHVRVSTLAAGQGVAVPGEEELLNCVPWAGFRVLARVAFWVLSMKPLGCRFGVAGLLVIFRKMAWGCFRAGG